jgi:hypothetical protein
MRRLLSLFALAALLGTPAANAQTPDFSGTWKIDLIKSDAAPAGRGGQQMDMSRVMLTITQTAETLTIVQTGMGPDRTLVYYLDGRESVNAGQRGEMKSTSKWDGNALVTDGVTNAETPMGAMTISTHEVRTLSKDGKEMTVTTTSDTPRGKMTRKTVFDRQ